LDLRRAGVLTAPRVVLTPDQITALAPDAASLKAGRDLGSPRKWQSLGSDDEALWGLAMGSGKDPYQTRVALADLASKCSCPSRKFPCKHAIGLMLIAANDPSALTQKQRPPWLTEWLDARAERQHQSAAREAEKSSAPRDEKAAAKRRQQRESRVAEGIALLGQSLLDLTREGLAAPAARDPATWENLARRMIDCQAPALAGTLRHIGDTLLRDPHVDTELPFELGRLHLLVQTLSTETPNPALRAELLAQIGGKSAEPVIPAESLEDDWFIAGRRVEERDRLITSSSWLLGSRSGRWARVLRFAPIPQSIVEPWPLGSTVTTALTFSPGLFPLRATPAHDGHAAIVLPPISRETHLDALLDRFATTLAANPFLRLAPGPQTHLADTHGKTLPWNAAAETALRVDCICGGAPALMCGEWDGRAIRLLAILDGEAWFPLTPQQA
jgi:hypothetical protein